MPSNPDRRARCDQNRLGAVEPPGPSPAPSRMRRVSAARRDVLENFPTSVGRTDLEVALDECLASLRFPFVAAFSRTL